MKTILAILLLLLASAKAQNFIIININTNTITSYFQLATNINGNNGQFVAWLNSINATNAWFFQQTTNVNAIATNTAAAINPCTNALSSGFTGSQTVVTNVLGTHGWTNFYSHGILTNNEPW